MKIFFVMFFFIVTFAQAKTVDVHEKYFKAFDKSQLISMDLKNTALVDVLRVFSKQSGMNFVADDDIADKKVTLFMENVPMEEALSRILDARQLTYTVPQDSNIFIVKSKKEDLITRVYNLRYASVSSSKLNNPTGSLASTSAATSSSGVDNKGGIVTVLRAVLSKQGTIVEDARTNSLIVTDLPRQFPSIELTIARLDVPVVQVMIEVEMLDISKSTSDVMGIKYGVEPLSFKGGQRDHIYPWNQNDLLRKGYAFEDAEYRVGTIDASGMKLALNFLKTQTDTKSLAKPRLMTLNNETAEIRISTNEAVGETTVEGGQSGNLTSTLERVQTGVFLTVTPQVNIETGEILMVVHPKVIEARRGGATFSRDYRDPEERGSQSKLVVNDGETIILGGLLRENDSNTVTKVPILGDMPFIGSAFRHKNKVGDQRELVIFITPHIMGSKSRMNGSLVSSAQSTLEQRSLEIDTLLDKLEISR